MTLKNWLFLNVLMRNFHETAAHALCTLKVKRASKASYGHLGLWGKMISEFPTVAVFQYEKSL